MKNNQANTTSTSGSDEALLQLAMGTLYRITAELALIGGLSEGDQARLDCVMQIAASRALKIDEHLAEKGRDF